MQEPPLTPEAKAALMQFVGQNYGAMNKQDQMIVGQSGNLQPNSAQLKQTFESIAKMPTVQMPPQGAPPQGTPPQQEPVKAPVAPVTPEQAAQELREVQQPPVQVQQELPPQSNDNQLDFDFTEPSKIDKMVDLLEKQNLILKEISLKLDNGKKVKINKQR